MQEPSEQTASSSHAGALTWIVGSSKGGFTRAYGFSWVFFPCFFFLFFFPLTLACPLFESCQSGGAKPGECGGAEGESPSH